MTTELHSIVDLGEVCPLCSRHHGSGEEDCPGHFAEEWAEAWSNEAPKVVAFIRKEAEKAAAMTSFLTSFSLHILADKIQMGRHEQ